LVAAAHVGSASHAFFASASQALKSGWHDAQGSSELPLESPDPLVPSGLVSQYGFAHSAVHFAFAALQMHWSRAVFCALKLTSSLPAQHVEQSSWFAAFAHWAVFGALAAFAAPGAPAPAGVVDGPLSVDPFFDGSEVLF
jgi:hypothetical protein